MKKIFIMLITMIYLFIQMPCCMAESDSLTSNVVLEQESVTLKIKEYKNYSRENIADGMYDVYILSEAKKDIALAVGADRYFQLVLYSLEENETYAGRLVIDEDTENIRIENTGKISFKYNGIVLKRADKEAQLALSESSIKRGDVIAASGTVTCFCQNSSIKLKVQTFENDVKSEERFYDIPCLAGEKTEFKENVVASGDKMVFSVWDSSKSELLTEEKTVYVGDNTDIYVCAGKTSGDGSKIAPFGTLEEAQRKIRALNKNMTGDITVHLNGTFNLSEKLTFSEEDSGSNGFKIIWDGEEGTEITGSCEPFELSCDVGTNYVKKKINFDPSFALYVNGIRAERAKSDKIKILSLYDDESYTGKRHNYDGVVVPADVFSGGVPNPEGMQMVFVHLWNRVFINIEEILKNSDGNYVIKFQQPEFDAFFSPKQIEEVFFYCYLENSPLFMDKPNEWCYDAQTKEIRYIPKRFMSMYGLKGTMARTEQFIEFNGAKDIKICGIDFTYGAWHEPIECGFCVLQADERYLARKETDEFDYGDYRIECIPAQISVKNSENINIYDNSFKSLGSVAVGISNKTNNCTVKGCEFYDISAAAITVGDVKLSADSVKEEFCRNILITENKISNVGSDFPSSPAVTVYYANNITVSQNEISDTPYSGISLGWGWGRDKQNCRDIRILNNKILRVMGVQNDGGHIYTLGAMPGTVICGNYMEASGDTRGGIYIDNSTQYVYIKDNVTEVVDTWLISQTSEMYNKRNNTAENNYSRVKYKISEPELNNYQEAKDMSVDENYAEAMEIVRKAGIILK